MKTIAVKDSTLQTLKYIKEKLKTETIDETINKIMEKTEKIQLSRFGKQPKLKKFKGFEKAKFREF